MRLPATGTKMVVHNTLESQHKPVFGQKHNGAQSKSTFDQKFSSPQKKSTETPVFSNKQQTLMTMRPDCSDTQKNGINVRSKSPSIVLNIPVKDNKQSKENVGQVDECEKLKDLMSNLSVSDGKSKTQMLHKKEDDFREKAMSLNDSFLKLNISARKNERLVQRANEEKDEGELIERGPVSSSRKLQAPVVHPYTQKSVLPLSARYSLQSGGVVAEQPYINSYDNDIPVIPQTVEELSNNSSINITTDNTEEIVTPEIIPDILAEQDILGGPDFLSFLGEWASKQIEHCEENLTYLSNTDFQLSVCSEPALGNTSPHCSGDSTYGTLSPDSNVVSPMSYTSPMSSPIYGGNEFINESLINETITSSSSPDSVLPNEPVTSLDLYDLIEGYLEDSRSGSEQQQNKEINDFGGFAKPLVDCSVVESQTQLNNQFYTRVSQINSATLQGSHVTNNNKITRDVFRIDSVSPQALQVINHKLLSEIPCSNSPTPYIQQVVTSRLPTEMSPTSTVPTSLVNIKLPSTNQSWNVAYNVNQFNNFTAPSVVTATPQKCVLANTPPTDYVQPNVLAYQTVYIPAKPSNQTPLNIPVVSTASQFMCGHNVVPNMLHTTSKPDNSVVSFICGDSAKKNISKSVAANPITRLSTPSTSLRPVERQILPAGCEVYETGMSVPALVRLKNLMEKKNFIVQYVKVSIDFANKPELLKEHLFQLLSETPKTQNCVICIYAHIILTVRMQSKATVLTARNSEGHSLLYLASINHPDQPMIARCIADGLLDLNISPDEICDINGNSLLHLLASLGDSHVAVLAELLNVRHPVTSQPVFNVNRPNDSKMETPLHIAVSKHSLPYVNCLATVKLLITHGANVAAQDKKAMTPLHYTVRGTCELKILTQLLQSETSHAALDVTDSQHNTALHLASANNGISVLKQKDIILSLIGHGANYRIQNMDGKMPLALVDVERRQEIKKLFLKK